MDSLAMHPAGLPRSDEDRAREIAAYLRELAQNEGRLRNLDDGHPDRPRVERTIEDIQDQLRVRGHEGAAGHRRASKREGRPGQEARA
jgi:hypothetical protein